MKKYSFNFISSKLKKVALLSMTLLSLFFTGCYDSDDVGGNLYTFQGQTIGEFLKDSTNFSEFYEVLVRSNVIGLVNSYGDYTCFAPDNHAMYEYYELVGKNSLDDFSMDSLRQIAYDHLVNGQRIYFVNFIDGRLPWQSMSDRYISISFSDTVTFVNDSSQIFSQDNDLHNGVIHTISKVLNPNREGVVEQLVNRPEYSLFYQALEETGLADSLLKIKDYTYDYTLWEDMVTIFKEDGGWKYEELPINKYYGYTIFVESNDTYAQNGITDLDGLKAYAAQIYNAMYPDDRDITNTRDRRNSLNRFVAYHLIEKELGYSRLIDAYDTDHMINTYDLYEYIETMCPNTLLEVKKDREARQTYINYVPRTGRYVQVSESVRDIDALNGVVHEITNILVYSTDVHNEFTTKRLRLDAASFFPELSNNNMRGHTMIRYYNAEDPETGQEIDYILPPGYVERVSMSEQTKLKYLVPHAAFGDFLGDELFIGASEGRLYDFTITTPPIPEGTYEVRFGYMTNGSRGVAQLYFDSIPAGVPLNLNLNGYDRTIGFETPGSVTSDPYGYENDKMMRNQGFMKAPASFRVPDTRWYPEAGSTARNSQRILRKILGTYEFRQPGYHTLMVKGLSSGEFMFDYLEFVPTSVIETEDIY